MRKLADRSPSTLRMATCEIKDLKSTNAERPDTVECRAFLFGSIEGTSNANEVSVSIRGALDKVVGHMISNRRPRLQKQHNDRG